MQQTDTVSLEAGRDFVANRQHPGQGLVQGQRATRASRIDISPSRGGNGRGWPPLAGYFSASEVWAGFGALFALQQEAQRVACPRARRRTGVGASLPRCTMASMAKRRYPRLVQADLKSLLPPPYISPSPPT